MTGRQMHKFILEDISSNYGSKVEFGKKAGISPSQLDYVLKRIASKDSHFGKMLKKFDKWNYEIILRKKS